MPKKIIITLVIILVFAVLGIGVLLRNKNSKPSNDNITQTLQPTSFNPPLTTSPVPTFWPNTNLNADDFAVEWVIVRDPEKIDLYTNLQVKLSSTEALSKYACNQLVSGGFYSQENKNLGLLIVNGKILENSIKSSLFNAYFYISNDNTFGISEDEPIAGNVRVALQSGPLLLKKSLPQSLKIENDEYARRVVVATTQKDEVAFLVLYYKPSPLLGPKLSDLPKMLDQIQKKTNLKFINALNLDGGSHSVFLTESVKVSEVSTPGTYFCIKP